MRSACFILLLAAIMFAQFSGSVVYALDVEQRLIYDQGISYFNIKKEQFLMCGSEFGNGGGQLSGPIPSVWADLINSVAQQYPTADPRLVAATLWAENRGWPEYKTTGWGVSKEASAAGPWQFIPSTWAIMGTDGDGDGRADPDNPKDAVHAAFKHQLGSAGKPIVATGYSGSNPESDFETAVFERNGTNLLSYMANYNGSGAPNGVKLRDFPRNENSDYVRMGYWLLASNFTKGWIPGSGEFVDASDYRPNVRWQRRAWRC